MKTSFRMVRRQTLKGHFCIDRRRSQYPVSSMRWLLKVSRSGYYGWRVRPESERAKQDQELTRAIRRIHTERGLWTGEDHGGNEGGRLRLWGA